MVRWMCIALVALALPAGASAAPALDGSFDVSGEPQRLPLGPDGNVWFTLAGSTTMKEFGRITPDGTVTEYDSPVANLIGITAGPDGNLWMTASNNLLRVSPGDPNAGTPIPNANIITAQTIVTGPDGKLWTASADKIFKIDTAGNETHYTVMDLTAKGIAAGGDENLRVVDFTGAAGTAGRIMKAPTSGTGDPTTIFDVTGNHQGIAAGSSG